MLVASLIASSSSQFDQTFGHSARLLCNWRNAPRRAGL